MAIEQAEDNIMEVTRQLAVQAHGEADTAYIDFIFRYKRTPVHTTCYCDNRVTVAINAPEDASFSVGYIEDNITDVILEQAGIDPRVRGIYAITHDELYEVGRYKTLLEIYLKEQPVRRCSEPWNRVETRGGVSRGRNNIPQLQSRVSLRD